MESNIIIAIAAITVLLILIATAIIFALIYICDKSIITRDEMKQWIKYAIEHQKTN